MTAANAPQTLPRPKTAPKRKPLPPGLHARTHHFVWSPGQDLDRLPWLLWGQHSVKDALSMRDYCAAYAPETGSVIVRMTMTFEIVEGGGDD